MPDMSRREPMRMPNGVMDYLERGATPVEQAEAECAAAASPPTFEQVQARLNDPDRPSTVRITGRPPMSVLAEWFARDEEAG